MHSTFRNNTSGCSVRTAGQHYKPQPRTRIGTVETGRCHVCDVRAALGDHRVFSPSECPRGLREDINYGSVDCGCSSIPIATNRVEMMKSTQGGYNHQYLFCIPRLSVAQIVKFFPNASLDVSELSPKLMGCFTGKLEKHWRWFIVPRMTSTTQQVDGLSLQDILYLCILFRQLTGENFLDGEIACKSGLGSNSLIRLEEDGKIVVPKWNGLGEVSRLNGMIISR